METRQFNNYREWVTSYYFGIGTTLEVKNGQVEKLPLSKDPIEVRKALKQVGKGVVIPKVAGIYQHSNPASETPEKRSERKELEAKMTELDTAILTNCFGMEDCADPDLIHIAYDSTLWPNAGLIRESLANPNNRIAISPLENIPNFYEKDTAELISLTIDKIAGLEQIESEEERLELIDSNLRKFAPQLRELKAEFLPFGLTRDEYTTLAIF